MYMHSLYFKCGDVVIKVITHARRQVVQQADVEYLLLALLEYWNEPRHTLSAAACLLRNALGE